MRGSCAPDMRSPARHPRPRTVSQLIRLIGGKRQAPGQARGYKPAYFLLDAGFLAVSFEGGLGSGAFAPAPSFTGFAALGLAEGFSTGPLAGSSATSWSSFSPALAFDFGEAAFFALGLAP